MLRQVKGTLKTSMECSLLVGFLRVPGAKFLDLAARRGDNRGMDVE